jgi:hypothetical protein
MIGHQATFQYLGLIFLARAPALFTSRNYRPKDITWTEQKTAFASAKDVDRRRSAKPTFLYDERQRKLRTLSAPASLVAAHLLVEVLSLLKGSAVVKDFIMILHFEADIARRRD